MLKTFLKIALSSALLTYLLLRIPVSEIWARLQAIDPTYFFGALILTLAAWWISAIRLWFLEPMFRLRDVVRVTFVALYYGTVLPGQVAGDMMKVYQLSSRQGSPGQAAAITLIDRAVATFALFLLGACAVPFVEQVPRTLMFLFAMAAAIFLSLLLLAIPRVHFFVSRLLMPKQPNIMRAFLGRLVDATNIVLQHPKRLIICFLLAIVFHVLCVAIHMVLAHALGIALPLATWILVYAGISLLLFFPISLAGLGLREGGYIGLLAIFGISASKALTMSLVFFSYILFGALLGWIVELSGVRES